MKSRWIPRRHGVLSASLLILFSVFALQVSASPASECLNQSFAIDSRDSIIGANDLGLVNGHITLNGRIEDVAEVRGLYAPPYFCGNFVFVLLFDGHRIAADHYVWRPESLMREGQGGKWKVATRLIPVAGKRAAILEVKVKNASSAVADLPVAFDVYGTVGRQEKWGFQKPYGETSWKDGVFSLDNVQPARVSTGWTLGSDMRATLRAVLPGESRKFHLAFAIDAPEVAKAIVRDALDHPDQTIQASTAAWEKRVERLVERMPTFDCDNAAYVRLYQRALLHLLLTEWNVDSFLLHPYYATGGMNGGCLCNYLWNFAGPHRLWPLLDPAALKAHIGTFLKLDLEKCFAFSPCEGSPQGPYYPINQEKIIFLIDAYVRETGDVAWLKETVAGRTVIEWVERMALTHDDLSKDAVLVDYGAAGETHLELHGKARYDGVMPDLNLRRIALLRLADSLCRMAGYPPKADLAARAAALKKLVRQELWDEKAGWFRVRCSDGQSKLRWTIQMFKALGYGRAVLDADIESALVAHLMNSSEFLGDFGVHSLSKQDPVYDESDIDNGGPGACPSFAPAICDRLLRDGRYHEAHEILSRFLWLGEKLPYWGDSQRADRPDYRRDTPLQCDIEGACFAQTIAFGLFGVRIDDNLKVSFDPHLPKGVKRMTLKNLRLGGKCYEIISDAREGTRIIAPDEDVWPVVNDQRPSRESFEQLRAAVPTELAAVAEPAAVTSACVKCVNGNPEFFVNGQPFYARWGAITLRRPDGRAWLGPMPLNALTVWNSPRKWITSDGQVRTEFFDEQAARYLKDNPGAYLMWDLTVSPSEKWRESHPDELLQDERGGRREFGPGRVPHSVASASANAEMASLVEAAIRYLESAPYAHRILSYRISGGETPEWLAYRPNEHWVYDFSPIARREFRQWAKQHYPELGEAAVPTLAEREVLDNGGEILWADPKRHLATIAFHEFYSDKMADAIIEVVGRVKRMVSGRKLVGTYCGYTMYLDNNGRDQMRAQFALKKVLDAKVIDYVMSPQSYDFSLRRLGGTLGDMKPFRSFEAHGVLCAIENDCRTHNTPAGVKYLQTLTAEQSLTTLRRDFAVELCRRHPLYFYSMNYGTELDFPEMREDGRIFSTLSEHLLRSGLPRRNAEVAVVVSEKSILATPMYRGSYDSGVREQFYREDGSVGIKQAARQTVLMGETFGAAPLCYARAGAPVDYLLAEDLADHPGDYKLYVFAFDFKYDDRFREAVARLRERGAAMLWLYAPGYTKGAESSLKNMRELTGLEFRRIPAALAAEAKMADGRWMGLREGTFSPMFTPAAPETVLGYYTDGSAAVTASRLGKSDTFFSGTWKIDHQLLREIYQRVGVHVYTDATDALEANEKLFTLHARFAGEKVIKLPRKTKVVDVFGRRLIGQDIDHFTFSSKLHETHLFYCADDALLLLSEL